MRKGKTTFSLIAFIFIMVFKTNNQQSGSVLDIEDFNQAEKEPVSFYHDVLKTYYSFLQSEASLSAKT